MTIVTRSRTGAQPFVALMTAEWTKLRSVRSWWVGLLSSIFIIVVVSLGGASGSTVESLDVTVGPDGEAVTDAFQFVHQPLPGDGSITARVGNFRGTEPLSPWAKAGVIIKDGTSPGAGYAALLVTPDHGMRLQSNFTDDRYVDQTGPADSWLRLTRDGDSVTGWNSRDGRSWREVGTVDVGFGRGPVEVGLFVASPDVFRTERSLAGSSGGSFPTLGTAEFDDVEVKGVSGSTAWASLDVGKPSTPGSASGEATSWTVSGSGDVAPLPPDTDAVRLSLTGVFIGVIPVLAVSVLLITAEFRHGMLAATIAAAPRRRRVVLAKAIVIALTAFAATLLAAAAAFLLSQPILQANGFTPPMYPSRSLLEGPVLRAVLGTAVTVGLLAVLALALGVILRRSAAAISIVVFLVVLPQLLVAALPVGIGRTLLLFTPGAGFGLQRTTATYEHVTASCLPEDGCLAGGPWLALAAPIVWAAVGLAVALAAIRRRDL